MSDNKTILVTGADGFIGSHLVEQLIVKGYQIKAMVQYNSFNSWGWLDVVKKEPALNVISGDIRDAAFCYEAMNGCQVVLHLAALIAIPYSYRAPQSFIDTNVSGTLNLLQAAKEKRIDHFIHTSTSEVYGSAQYVPIDESHPIVAQSPYAASKVAADALALSYYRSFDLPVTIARPFNTYGPRQSARAIIPSIICQLASNCQSIAIGNTLPTRNFNYVTDTCTAFESLIGNTDAIGQTFNMGSVQEISIGDLFDMINRLMQKNARLVTDDKRMRPGKSEVQRLSCNSSKLLSYTNYEPKYSLEQGLLRTIAWFQCEENLKKYKALNYNL